MNKRLIYLDIAKAICIILVVIGHYVPDGCPSWWMCVHNVIYGFHMPLFMFASGYVYIATKRDGESYWGFITKKVKRLMVPYFVVSAIVITIKLLTQGIMYVENPTTVMSYMRMLYLPEAGYFLWFIWALWWMFVFLPLFKSKKARAILFCVSIILHYAPLGLTEVFCLTQFKSMLVYFMLGVMFFDWKGHLSLLAKIPTIAVIIVFILLNISALYGIGGGNLKILLPYVGIAFILSVSKYMEKRNVGLNLWLSIASASYIIYLLHTTFEGFAKALVLKLPYLGNINNDLMFLIGAVIVISVGVIGPFALNKLLLQKFNLTRILFGLGPIKKNI